ncbi:MAG: V-type ATP synthase subunit I [Candidatus Atribacteria bacterium]|nr:V-type ATP synthase subunit I [Candidatus Atribacteria bacterium]
MAISEVSKFHIFAHLSIKESLLNELQKLGFLEIIQIEEKEEFCGWNNLDDSSNSPSSASLNDVKFCIDFLSNYANEEDKGIKSLFTTKKTYSYDELEKIEQQHNFSVLHAQCKKLDNELNELNLQENRLNAVKAEIERWQELELDLSKIDDSKHIKFILGSIAKNSFSNLALGIEQQVGASIIQLVGEEKNRVNMIIITLVENTPKIEPLLQQYLFETFKYSHTFTGTPKQILKTIKEQLLGIEKKRREMERNLKKLHSKNQFIYPLYDFLFIIQEKEETKKYLKKSEKTLAIRGWVQNKDIPKLQKRLKEKFSAYEVSFSSPKEDEQIPVALKNTYIVKPFETITELYSLPGYYEIDPTPILSIFYFVFFGLALSDVGYGATLAIITYFALKRLDLGEGGKKFLRLLHYCGLSAITGGILLGSWFGDILNYLPPMFDGLKIFLMQKLPLINPTKNPIPLLILSLTLGVIQIYTGIILKFLDNVRKGKLIDGLMDQISWLSLLTGIILVLLKGVLPLFLERLSLILAYAGIITIVLTQGRGQKNILLKLGGGILALYDISGYFSDVLSYSRLFALGLATGVLGQMFNMVATMFHIPYIGFFVTLLILVIGHTFNLLMSGLGSFIHDARLQYVEFFSKFYEAGGIPFRPFTLRTLYTKIKDIEE